MEDHQDDHQDAEEYALLRYWKRLVEDLDNRPLWTVRVPATLVMFFEALCRRVEFCLANSPSDMTIRHAIYSFIDKLWGNGDLPAKHNHAGEHMRRYMDMHQLPMGEVTGRELYMFFLGMQENIDELAHSLDDVQSRRVLDDPGWKTAATIHDKVVPPLQEILRAKDDEKVTWWEAGERLRQIRAKEKAEQDEEANRRAVPKVNRRKLPASKGKRIREMLDFDGVPAEFSQQQALLLRLLQKARRLALKNLGVKGRPSRSVERALPESSGVARHDLIDVIYKGRPEQATIPNLMKLVSDANARLAACDLPWRVSGEVWLYLERLSKKSIKG